MLNPIPAHITDDGEVWTLTRAWPRPDGSVTFEAASPGSRHVRGGRITATGSVDLAPLATDPRLPQLAQLAATGDIVVHRPGRRAVIRSADRSHYIKVVREGRAPDVVDATGRGIGFAPAFRVPAVLGVDSSAVRFEALSGRTLHRVGGDTSVSSTAWTNIWAHWTDAWTTAVSGSSAGNGQHSADAECEVVRTWAAHAARLGSDGEARETGNTAARVCELLQDSVPDPLVLSHRDLHDKQLLWDPSVGLALLDLDTATRAEAALDLGNLAAHTTWRLAQGAWSPHRAAVTAAAVRVAAERLGVSPARFHAYETAARFRIACVYGYRPRWAALAADARPEIGQRLRERR